MSTGDPLARLRDLPEQVRDTARRALRTFLQAFLATLLVLLPTDFTGDAAVVLDALYAAGWAGVIALVSWLHGVLEDTGVKVPVPKVPGTPPSTPPPSRDDFDDPQSGEVDVRLITLLAIAAAGVAIVVVGTVLGAIR